MGKWRKTIVQRFKAQRTRWLFVGGAVIALAVLVVCGCHHLARTRRDDGLPIFNLWVDITVGIFTVVGLYWAAGEFAKANRPPAVGVYVGTSKCQPHDDLAQLHIYALSENEAPLVVGWQRARTVVHPVGPPYGPNLAVGVFLKNEDSRPERSILVEIRVAATPALLKCRFYHKGYGFLGQRIAESATPAGSTDRLVHLRLTDSLVLYRSQPVYIGALRLTWARSVRPEQLPARVELTYRVYSLGGVRDGRLELIVEWRR